MSILRAVITLAIIFAAPISFAKGTADAFVKALSSSSHQESVVALEKSFEQSEDLESKVAIANILAEADRLEVNSARYYAKFSLKFGKELSQKRKGILNGRLVWYFLSTGNLKSAKKYLLDFQKIGTLPQDLEAERLVQWAWWHYNNGDIKRSLSSFKKVWPQISMRKRLSKSLGELSLLGLRYSNDMPFMPPWKEVDQEAFLNGLNLASASLDEEFKFNKKWPAKKCDRRCELTSAALLQTDHFKTSKACSLLKPSAVGLFTYEKILSNLTKYCPKSIKVLSSWLQGHPDYILEISRPALVRKLGPAGPEILKSNYKKLKNQKNFYVAVYNFMDKKDLSFDIDAPARVEGKQVKFWKLFWAKFAEQTFDDNKKNFKALSTFHRKEIGKVLIRKRVFSSVREFFSTTENNILAEIAFWKNMSDDAKAENLSALTPFLAKDFLNSIKESKENSPRKKDLLNCRWARHAFDYPEALVKISSLSRWLSCFKGQTAQQKLVLSLLLLKSETGKRIVSRCPTLSTKKQCRKLSKKNKRDWIFLRSLRIWALSPRKKQDDLLRRVQKYVRFRKSYAKRKFQSKTAAKVGKSLLETYSDRLKKDLSRSKIPSKGALIKALGTKS